MNILISVNWLRDYLKTDVAAKTIATELSLCGPSVERIDKKGEDYIFDIEVTTNRPDAFSVFGIAREAYAILKNNKLSATLTQPKGLNLNLDPDVTNKLNLDVVVTEPNLCPRFTALVLDNIKIKDSPAQIKNRLNAVGIRPINNVVDITNYVMLELGQPMHAFDFDKIKGAKMLLRKSKRGEKITTLDGAHRKLPEGSIVIEDKERLIDLCGIMGGQNSQITTRTKRVVFFVQAYDPITIRKTTQALAFRTDAAARFEKGVDLETIPQVLSRAVYLAKKNAGAKIASELVDIYPKKQASKKITVTYSKINDYLGIEIEPQKAKQILDSLGFETKISESNLTATPPTWRAQDVTDDVDLIEEIARIYGYHNLPSEIPTGPIPNSTESILKDAIELKKFLRDIGLTEVITYSIISKKLLDSTGIKPEAAVELANPLTEEWQFMRPTLLPSHLEVISKNQVMDPDITIFEIARTYLSFSSSQPSQSSSHPNLSSSHSSLSSSRKRGSDSLFQGNDKGLPTQDLVLTITQLNSDFYRIKGIVESVLNYLKREVVWEIPKTQNAFFDKNQSAILKIEGKEVGIAGLISQSVSNTFGIESGVAAAEINLTAIMASEAQLAAYKPIPKYPPVIEDISALFDIQTPSAKIISTVKGSSTLVKQIEIIDVFESEKLGKDKKSVTLRLTYQKSTGTPTQDEVTEAKNAIIKELEKSFQAQIRK